MVFEKYYKQCESLKMIRVLQEWGVQIIPPALKCSSPEWFSTTQVAYSYPILENAEPTVKRSLKFLVIALPLDWKSKFVSDYVIQNISSSEELELFLAALAANLKKNATR